jgi:hypothetical protein
MLNDRRSRCKRLFGFANHALLVTLDFDCLHNVQMDAFKAGNILFGVEPNGRTLQSIEDFAGGGRSHHNIWIFGRQ